VVGKVVTVGKPHVYVWQVSHYYESGWSPIRELVEAGVTYSQANWPTGSSQRAKQSHLFILVFSLLL